MLAGSRGEARFLCCTGRRPPNGVVLPRARRQATGPTVWAATLGGVTDSVCVGGGAAAHQSETRGGVIRRATASSARRRDASCGRVPYTCGVCKGKHYIIGIGRSGVRSRRSGCRARVASRGELFHHPHPQRKAIIGYRNRTRTGHVLPACICISRCSYRYSYIIHYIAGR